MKTIVIWDEMGNAPITFIVLDGDYSRFDGIYVNSALYDGDDKRAEAHAAKVDELFDLMYTEDGNFKHNVYSSFPLEEVYGDSIYVRPKVKVITAGIVP